MILSLYVVKNINIIFFNIKLDFTLKAFIDFLFIKLNEMQIKKVNIFKIIRENK